MQPFSPPSTNPPDRIVIIGAGQAGGWAARTLRSENFTGAVTLVGEESWPPHERPPLSKNVLAGDARPDSTYLFRRDELQSLDIDWRNNRRAISIDRNARTVELDNGCVLAWDRLILCTGGRARSLSIPGLGDCCMTLRTIDDAGRLRNELRASRRLLIIGGGWIGLEVASTARRLGVAVTVAEAAPQLCARSLPAPAARMIEALHRANGVEILLGREIQSAYKGADGSITIRLGASGPEPDGSRAGRAIGEPLEFDTVLAGVGMAPNDHIARTAGIACANGIIVDEYCRTSDPFICAAGDVAISANGRGDALCRLESWQNAQQQGIAAARCALGIEDPYHPLPWFWSDQFGVNIQILGETKGADEQVVRGGARGTVEPGAMLFYLRGGALQGVIGFDAGRDIRAARRLIERNAAPDRRALADPSLPLKNLA